MGSRIGRDGTASASNTSPMPSAVKGEVSSISGSPPHVEEVRDTRSETTRGIDSLADRHVVWIDSETIPGDP
ncbi:hypothetical protein [Halovenus salina]|nr:hypothetical protein [Halovenus salina]